ncbi:argonaute/piwi family protein [Actinospica robiniae]|uniref:argonaute/piwi family protein n=1 Tax=Actinospica robiniae TaxID=304901 RepID=UPI000553CC5B|nr:Piwi domain-containing protein [Actinospica robiniae]
MLNYLPVRYKPGKFSAGVLPFDGPEQLKKLSQDLAASHVVVRLGPSIVCVPTTVDAPVVGAAKKFDTEEDLSVVTPLLRAAVGRILTERWRFELLRRQPLDFVSRLPGRDLLVKAAGGVHLEGLHVYPQYRLEARRRGPGKIPGLLVGIKTRYEIDLPVSELMRRGISVQGRYVMAHDGSKPTPGMDPRASRRLLGRVTAVHGDTLQLTDSSGRSEVAASDVWLESRREALGDVLEVAAGRDFKRIESQLAEEQFRFGGAEGRLARIEEISNRLISLNPLTIAPDVRAAIGAPAGTTRPVPVRKMEAPTFVFDLAGGKTHRFVRPGLEKFGPVDSEGFTPKTPRITLITPQQFAGRAEQYLNGLLYGLPGTSYEKGFVRTYSLVDCKVERVVFEGGACDPEAYRQACLRAAAGTRPDLAFVVVSEEQEHLAGDESPYYVSKSILMGQGIPVQEVQIETIETADLPSTCSSIAMACYAKLGGTPFVIATTRRPMAHELVIGIGRADVQTTRHGTGQRFVGITTVFSSDGNYLLSNASHQTTYEHYPQELLRTLKSCIRDVESRDGWQRDDTIRLIFHVFKPLKDAEAQAVKGLVEQLTSRYAGIDFAFLHVSDDHDWLMFDPTGAGRRSGRRTIGKAVPTRGLAVEASGSEMLITVTDAADMKQPLQGAPRPLKIQLHRESTFTDLHYLAGQVLRFSALSWRRFFPDHLPVTIRYSTLIADLLGHLRAVTNWNPDSIFTTELRHSRWFL